MTQLASPANLSQYTGAFPDFPVFSQFRETQTPGLSVRKVLSLDSSMFSFPPVCIPVCISYVCALLGYYASYSRDSYPTFRINLSVPSSRGKNSFTLYSSSISSPFKMQPTRTETSVWSYRFTLGNIPEEPRSRLFRGESLKSRRPICIFTGTVGSTVRSETLILANVHVKVF